VTTVIEHIDDCCVVGVVCRDVLVLDVFHMAVLCTWWDPSAQSEENKSEQVRQCMYGSRTLSALWLHLEPTHLRLS
jgi:hypothetical protein